MLPDNLGYGELGCYGGGILRGAPTPRIDVLGSEGTRLLAGESGPVPKIVNLHTDDEQDVAAKNTWVAEPMVKILGEFMASLKKYPPIKVGTPDPYLPPTELERELELEEVV